MYVAADTLGGHFLDEFLPDDMDFELLEDTWFVEAELADLTNGKLRPDPNLGLDVALHYAEQGNPVIVIGVREYPELPVWKRLTKMDNVAFCLKEDLTKDAMGCAIQKVMPGLRFGGK